METIFGKAVYSGIAIGSVFKYSRYVPNISQDTGLPICEEKELARWEQVCAQADAELSAMVSAAKGTLLYFIGKSAKSQVILSGHLSPGSSFLFHTPDPSCASWAGSGVFPSSFSTYETFPSPAVL